MVSQLVRYKCEHPTPLGGLDFVYRIAPVLRTNETVMRFSLHREYRMRPLLVFTRFSNLPFSRKGLLPIYQVFAVALLCIENSRN